MRGSVRRRCIPAAITMSSSRSARSPRPIRPHDAPPRCTTGDLIMDYATLKLIWWALIGVLLVGFALTDGFDMGTAILLPFIGRTDAERRVVVNTVGATWE